MSHETPGIRWFASELIRFFWRQAIGEVTNYMGWGHRLSLSERGRVAAWLASAESQVWWHLLQDVDQSRALAQDSFVEAVEEILELDADPMHVGELRDEDRGLLTEALHYLEILRERERNGVPPPRGEAWTMVLESAAEEVEVSETKAVRLDGDDMVREGARLFRDAPDLTALEVYEALQEDHDLALTPSSWQNGGYATKSRRLAEEELELDEPAPEAADTPREESPSGPEPHEGGTDSASEEQPEDPSGEPEETGSTPGGEEVCEDPVQESPTPQNGRRPTIHLENAGERFVATLDGAGKWNLELRVEGVDPEVAENLHDVAFGLLFPRVRDEVTS